MISRWQRLRLELRLLKRRLQLLRRPAAPRNALRHASHVRSHGDECLRAEACIIAGELGDGVALSVYAGREEVLRFDCLGEGGHYHVNTQQSAFAAHGAVPRHAFLADEVAAQIDESERLLERNLENAIACNWDAQTRAIAIDAPRARAFAAAACALLRELNAVRTSAR